MNSTSTTERTFPKHDIIDSMSGAVAHLSYRFRLDEHGAWYSLCGKVVTGFRVGTLDDTDHERICRCCERKAGRR